MKKNKNIKALPWFGIPKIAPFILKQRKYLILAVITGTIYTAIMSIFPLFQQYAIDHFITDSTLDTLPAFITIFAVLMVFYLITDYISVYASSQAELYCDQELRSKCFRHLQELSFSYYNTNSVGYIHSRVMSDTSRIGELMSWELMEFIWNGVYIVIAIVVMFSINWKLALLVFAIVPLTSFLSAFMRSKVLKINRNVREINSQITGNFSEAITGAKTIKTLSIENKITDEFTTVTKTMKRESIKLARMRALFNGMISFASSFALAIVLWYGGIINMEGVLLIGMLATFMSYAQGMMEPLRWVVTAIFSLINAQTNIERVVDLLETKPDISDTAEVIEKYGDQFEPKKENWEKLEGKIEFKDVTFIYPDGDEKVLENFDLTINKGDMIAIVGETGAGKSTIVNLICRFFKPTKGEILIDDVNVDKRSQLWLHSNIGYVLQSPHLFSGTVRDNIKYGNENATDEQIIEALKAVNAYEIVEKMEKGLDSMVGEGGDNLSVGEKQLLTFARAFIADPAILILDEATASVDTLTENRIQNAISTIIKGRTTIMIAHRLSTVRNANEILVIKNGKIIERGTHENLLRSKGYYYNLYSKQFEEDTTRSVLGQSD